MTPEQLARDYAAFTERHGHEPSLLKCSQTAYLNLVRHESHTDFDTGFDERYQAALVVVANVNGWVFE